MLPHFGPPLLLDNLGIGSLRGEVHQTRGIFSASGMITFAVNSPASEIGVYGGRRVGDPKLRIIL